MSALRQDISRTSPGKYALSRSLTLSGVAMKDLCTPKGLLNKCISRLDFAVDRFDTNPSGKKAAARQISGMLECCLPSGSRQAIASA